MKLKIIKTIYFLKKNFIKIKKLKEKNPNS